MARPRPVAPGSMSPNQPKNSNTPLRTGAKEAMREMARRKAAASMGGGTTQTDHRYGDYTYPAPPPPFAGFGWEEVHGGTDGESSNRANPENGDFVPR